MLVFLLDQEREVLDAEVEEFVLDWHCIPLAKFVDAVVHLETGIIRVPSMKMRHTVITKASITLS
jgi:hypothetical protein